MIVCAWGPMPKGAICIFGFLFGAKRGYLAYSPFLPQEFLYNSPLFGAKRGYLAYSPFLPQTKPPNFLFYLEQKGAMWKNTVVKFITGADSCLKMDYKWNTNNVVCETGASQMYNGHYVTVAGVLAKKPVIMSWNSLWVAHICHKITCRRVTVS